MKAHRVGTLVVVEAEHAERLIPTGILTDRDLVLRLLAERADGIAQCQIADVVSGLLVTAQEFDDTSAVLRRMADFAVRRVPIVDAKGALVGILSLDDILRITADEADLIVRLLQRGLGAEKAKSHSRPRTRTSA